MQVGGLGSSVVYFNVKMCDIWEGKKITRSKNYIEIIRSLRLWDIREGVTLRRLILEFRVHLLHYQSKGSLKKKKILHSLLSLKWLANLEQVVKVFQTHVFLVSNLRSTPVH